MARWCSRSSAPTSSGAERQRLGRGQLGRSAQGDREDRACPGVVRLVPPMPRISPWQIESPSPVPLSASLVVTKGSNSRSSTAFGMPPVLSATVIRTLSPTASAAMRSRRGAPAGWPAKASRALPIRLASTCSSGTSWAMTRGPGAGPSPTSSATSASRSAPPTSARAPSSARRSDTGEGTSPASAPRANRRRCSISSLARAAWAVMRWSRTATPSGLPLRSARAAFSAASEMMASGCFSLCASPAAISPSAASRPVVVARAATARSAWTLGT